MSEFDIWRYFHEKLAKISYIIPICVVNGWYRAARLRRAARYHAYGHF